MADNELKNGYYEGPRENQYEGWTQEEIDDDLKKAFEKNKELKEWPPVNSRVLFITLKLLKKIRQVIIDYLPN
jgi:hypothetical protein